LGDNSLDEKSSQYHSIWPIYVILLGWMCSILILPEYKYMGATEMMPAGAVLALGLLLTVIIAVARQPDSLFRVENLVMLGIFYWVVLDAVQGAYDYWGVSRTAMVKSFCAIALFGVSVWVGSIWASTLKVKASVREFVSIDADFLFVAVLSAFLLSMLRVFIACKLDLMCIAGGLLAPRFESPWHTLDVANLDTILVHLQNLGKLIPPLTVALFYMERRFSWRVFLCLLLGIIALFIVIQSGGRRHVGMVVGASLFVWLLLLRPLKWRHLVAATAVAACLIYLMEIMVTWRNEGFSAVFEERVVYEDYSGHEPLIKVDRNLKFMAYIMDVVPERHPHTGWEGIYSILAAPIPRSILPGKPAVHAFPIRDYVSHLPQAPSWTWTCSSVCDFYLIGGFLGVSLGGFAFGVMAYFANGLLVPPVTIRKALMYGVIAMVLFISIRAVREVMRLGLGVVLLWMILLVRQFLLNRWKILSNSRG